MTNNLKTLKDIEGIYGRVDINELKAEAIKWVESRIQPCKYCNRGLVSGKWLVCNEHQFWMDRFNITEDDLK